MSFDIERLYALIPAAHRVRDAQEGEPLKALLEVIADQAAALEENLDQLYDDQFIETCADWVVPYIGDALGVRPIRSTGGGSHSDLRSYVSDTIAYRRRKGTLAVLEELARDLTGWTARGVEFFQLLAITQYLSHLTDHKTAIHLSDLESLDLIGSAFEDSYHTAEIRNISSGRGRYNIPNLGLFLWRLEAYSMDRAPAGNRTQGYFFSPMAADMPLFHHPVTEIDISHLAEEGNVPGQIRPLALCSDLKGFQDQYQSLPDPERPRHSLYYGPDRSFAIYKDGILVPPLDLVVADLSCWCVPTSGLVAVDPLRGRITFHPGEEPGKLDVTYNYGFSSNLGGGPYDRSNSLAQPAPGQLFIEVSKNGAIKTLQAARTAWQTAGRPDCLIRILDNEIYGGQVDLAIPAGIQMVIEAADGKRPTWRTVGNTEITCLGPVGPEAEKASLTLNGFLFQGSLQIGSGLDLQLKHCTLVPGRLLNEEGRPSNPELDSLRTINPNDKNISVILSRTITGSIRLPAAGNRLSAKDSIVQGLPVGGISRPAIAANDAGSEPGPEALLERCTVFGPVYVEKIEGSEVLFTDPVRVDQRQTGCLRFSHVPLESITPRRYQCQPDLSLKAYAQAKSKTLDQLNPTEMQRTAARVKPRFTSCRYSHPAYTQLHTSCAVEIREGGQDGTEMGAYQTLLVPYREANLRAALQEYLRYGLEAGILYVT